MGDRLLLRFDMVFHMICFYTIYDMMCFGTIYDVICFDTIYEMHLRFRYDMVLTVQASPRAGITVDCFIRDLSIFRYVSMIGVSYFGMIRSVVHSSIIAPLSPVCRPV